MSNVTGSFQLMKSLNRSLVLNKIRSAGAVSRAAIAKETKLTPPTVTNIVNELIESNLVRESEMGTSKGGRKPVLLTINDQEFFIIGLDVGARKIRGVLTDLNAKELVADHAALYQDISADQLTERMTQMIEDLIQSAGVERTQVVGVGVGMHGIVDHEQGVARFAPTYHLKEIPIKEQLETAVKLPVFVENDAKAMALGELWFGAGRGCDNLIAVNIGVGIGAGIIFNNRLYHGHNAVAGELGHTIIDINGSPCSCGSFGCLQTVAGGDSIAERAARELASGRESLLREKIAGKDEINGEIVYECALAGDQLCIDILQETGRYLGVGMTNVINLMNPAKLIIGGGVSKAGDFILGPLQDVVSQRALTDEVKQTNISTAELQEHATVIGAVTIVLADLFTPDLLNAK
ncbi:ROK family transcriptional regulator [Salisediminibacterium halotolerans]|uniref:ROK family protein (Putative glucokinase) n=1 Tax=Salisediminibacterium halotolerans TaxID=517425 RepID=A0A1H9QL71_9BACI|nr:ROK family transcriptional regulator [Salisediminibacterium haloalkalitolerans]SER61266.1 ROK family protein (putative glucokinase) [Salisediminibacterium haloalkalitolerans]